MITENQKELTKEFKDKENILLVQDIDGVCIPLVNDPLTRVLEKSYIY